MRQGYWLAGIPALALCLGAVRGARSLARRPTLVAVFLTLLALGMGLAMFYMTLRVPSYAQAKAFYVHLALVPVCLAFALGADWILARSTRAGLVFAFALGVWGLNAWGSFWMPFGSVELLLQDAGKALSAGNLERARGAYARVLQREPTSLAAQAGLCGVQVRLASWLAARKVCDAVLARAPDHVETGLRAARVDIALGDGSQALARLAALSVGDDGRVYAARASLLAHRGAFAEAAIEAREWLCFDPSNPRARDLAGRTPLPAPPAAGARTGS
jgi:tetratricopeptide (TPR) repeat protein